MRLSTALASPRSFLLCYRPADESRMLSDLQEGREQAGQALSVLLCALQTRRRWQLV
jgi:hypothetical protein